MKVAIIGGGAAGFFSAIHVKINYPEADVEIFEKSKKILSKLKISGGGRCNVTNGVNSIRELIDAYPRGSNSLKKAFRTFNNKDTFKWFETRGVPLVIQEDNCVFPKSQNSQSIINCFLNETTKLNIKIRLNKNILEIKPKNGKIELAVKEHETEYLIFDKVIISTGGSPRLSGLYWLQKLGHKMEDPIPSLFTFNMPNEPIRELMGIVVENVSTSIQGTKFKGNGPLLITHWGMSGPAILKLSAFGARYLSEKQYKFNVQINWVNEKNTETVFEFVNNLAQNNINKKLSNLRPYFLPDRLWKYLIKKMGISENKKWGELGKKGLNKIVTGLTNDIYAVHGKSTYKDEFVTCGGISLESINFNTMQSKVVPNLYFAGELIDVDGITGGFNFQAAWTTGFIAAKLN